MFYLNCIGSVITQLVLEKLTVKLFMLMFNQCPFVLLLTLFCPKSFFFYVATSHGGSLILFGS